MIIYLSQAKKTKWVITSAWPYASGAPHLGNLIGSTLSADVFARFLRMKGDEVVFVSGSDSHGTPVAVEAKKQGISAEELALKNHEIIKELHCNAFAYIHGHEFGGTNPALLKSLAYGNCVLSLDTVFNREVLKNGEYGLLYRKEIDDLKIKIEQIENDPGTADVYRKKSRKRINENYTWEKITNEYLEIFKKLLKS